MTGPGRRKAAAKTQVTSVRLPVKLLERARRIAARQRRSLANYIALCVERGVRADEGRAVAGEILP